MTTQVLTKDQNIGRSLLRLAVVAAISAVLSGGALLGQTGWQPQDPGTTGNTFNHVSAINKNVAWVVGRDALGAVALRTQNGGTGWTKYSDPSTPDLFSCSAVDADHLWAGGYYGTVRHTQDGGSTWITAESTWPHGYDIYAVDDEYVFMVGWDNPAGEIAARTPGGAWNIVYAYGYRGLYGVTAVDVSNVWAVGAYGHIVSSNGGAGWTEQTSPTGANLNGIDSVNRLVIWAVGDGGAIIKTVDGGAHWFPQTSGTNVSLTEISAVNDMIAWAVGDSGTILKTVDGGATWYPQLSGTTERLNSVSAVDANTAWAVGENNLILYCADGGDAGAAPLAADIDGDGQDEIVGDYNSLGLWAWDSGVWTQLSGLNPVRVNAGDLAGNPGKTCSSTSARQASGFGPAAGRSSAARRRKPS